MTFYAKWNAEKGTLASSPVSVKIGDDWLPVILDDGLSLQDESYYELSQDGLTIRQRKAIPIIDYAAANRIIRDELLSESDWSQLSDSPVLKEEWAVYRQALRDAPMQITEFNLKRYSKETLERACGKPARR